MRARIAMAVALAAGSCAFADLDGTEINQFTLHTGQFGQLIGGPYEYGTVTIFEDPGFPQFSYTVSSPGEVPGFDNSVQYDFANFAYTDFGGETGMIMADQIVEDVQKGSLVILGDDAATEIGFDYTAGPGGEFEGTWNVDDALAFGGGTSDVSIFVCWNSEGGDDCPGDCNGDGNASVLDFVCFQLEWQDQTEAGDCNGDGQYSILDFVCFQLEWQEFAKNGCP